MLLLFLHINVAAAGPGAPDGLICETAHTFYVISHGKHTGIAVDHTDLTSRIPSLDNDLGEGDYLEVGWGDEQFYQAKEITTALAMRAILWPTTTVLHIVEIPGTPRQFFPASEVVKLSVPHTGYKNLLAYIADTFVRNADNDIIGLGAGLYGNSRFYKATGNFHAFNTCNTWVIKAVASTGYPLENINAITAGDVMSQLQEDKGIDCYSVQN